MEIEDKPSGRKKRVVSFVLGCVPFLLVVMGVTGTVFFLQQKISARQAVMEEQRKTDADSVKSPTRVVTMEMMPRTIKDKITLPGIVQPWVALQVVAEVGGKIIDKRVTEGITVNQGDLLAVIDKRDYQNLYDSALASYDTAVIKKNRLKALSGNQFVTQSRLDDAVAQVKTTRAALANARLNLSRCMIRSPIKGIVNKVSIEKGQFMGTADPVVSILQIDKVKVEVGIPESDVDAVRTLSTFNMTIDALADKSCQGSLYYLSKTTGDLARLYTLQIAVENPEHRILPGMFARVHIVKKSVDQGLAVPMYTLISNGNQTGVFVEQAGTARYREVETGIQEGWDIEITRGIAPGEHVVVVGHRIIEDGEPIKVAQMIKNMTELTQ